MQKMREKDSVLAEEMRLAGMHLFEKEKTNRAFDDYKRGAAPVKGFKPALDAGRSIRAEKNLKKYLN